MPTNESTGQFVDGLGNSADDVGGVCRVDERVLLAVVIRVRLGSGFARAVDEKVLGGHHTRIPLLLERRVVTAADGAVERVPIAVGGAAGGRAPVNLGRRQ